MGIAFLNNRHHIFAAADFCYGHGESTEAITRLLTEEEATSSFAAWEDERGPTGVTMRLAKSASGELIAHFEPPSASAA